MMEPGGYWASVPREPAAPEPHTWICPPLPDPKITRLKGGATGIIYMRTKDGHSTWCATTGGQVRSFQDLLQLEGKLIEITPERNPDATKHYQDGFRDALRKIHAKMPSRYRGLVEDTAAELGIDL